MIASRGVCLARQGQRDGAVKTIDILLAVKDSIDHIFGLRDAARISAVLGERDQAVSYLKEISKLTGRLELRFANDRDFERVANYPPYLAITRPI